MPVMAKWISDSASALSPLQTSSWCTLPTKNNMHCSPTSMTDAAFRNWLHTATGILQRRFPKEECRVMGLITLHGPWDITTLPSLPLGVPYPLIEHGPHLGACGHPDHPPCPRLIPPDDHLCLLLGGRPLDEARVDDLLNYLKARHRGSFISFYSSLG